MQFRTEIARIRPLGRIDHDRPIVLIGSCFSDEIGKRLEADGFAVTRNPFGPLYNPLSVGNCLRRALEPKPYSGDDLIPGPRGFHCLDYASRFSDPDAEGLIEVLNGTLASLGDALRRRPVVIITLGSAFVYRLSSTGRLVGNCHKFPATEFGRSLADIDSIVADMKSTVDCLRSVGIDHIIFTVSPIRHLADGLHGNNLSKSTLLLAIDDITKTYPAETEYFPSYEMLIDDLRDYRFYASDMKHPSDVAVDYIYSQFSETYFSPNTRAAAAEARSRYRASLHRPIL